MGESSRRNLWKRNRRSTCEGGNSKLPLIYSGTPKSTIKKKDNQKESIRKWQRQWEEKTKGVSTKEIFPSVEIRLVVNLNTCPNMTNNYDRPWKYSILLASIKIIGYPECPCKHGTQTVD